ncbi:MAG: N-acetylmuramoyl-L-alanine amidase [Clostridia bacterium]|nr:N-acetylmuramoyl-L-alanine amidase [Clostridia bacterium]
MKRYLRARLAGNLVLMIAIVFLACIAALFREEKPQNSEIELPSNTELTLPVIMIDPGHGGADCGAVGINGILEKDVNLKLSMYVAEAFESAGYSVLLTRDTDIMLTDESAVHTTKKSSDLSARVKASDAADIFISIHMNKFPEEKYSGAQIYYSVNDPLSQKLAQMIQDGVRASLQQENTRSVKSGEGLFLLDRITVPAVICECGFLSNKAEAEKLADEEYLRALAFEIFSAIDDFVIESCFQST